MHILFKCSWNITKIDHICQIIKTLEQQQQKKPEIIQTIFSESRSVMSNSLWPHGLYSPWNSPGQNTEWVAFPFSRGSSLPRDGTQVSHFAGEFFTSWATREAIFSHQNGIKLEINNKYINRSISTCWEIKHHILGFQFKIAESKDMCSSIPMRAPKSQLAVEHPSTGEYWNCM